VVRRVAIAVAAALVGLIVGLLFIDPLPMLAFGLGLLLGCLCSIFFVPALRAAPAGITGAAMYEAAAGWAEFYRELARARRFEGQFAIARFSTGGLSDYEALVDLRRELASISRRIDRLWIDEDNILLLLPGTTQAAAEAALARILERVPAGLAVDPGVAMYPEHGITSGALIAAVYGSGNEDVPTPIGAVRPELWMQATSSTGSDSDAAAGPPDDVAGQRG
jgi:hypothetical protein